MNKLSRNEWIGVGVGVCLIAYFFFGGSITSIFGGDTTNNEANIMNATNASQSGGLTIVDEVVGSGQVARVGDTLTVHYELSLGDGKIIQNSKDFGRPFEFTLGAGAVIPGWDSGLAGMQQGGVRLLTIPPELGYGARPAGPIPANSTLHFRIELEGVSASSADVQGVSTSSEVETVVE